MRTIEWGLVHTGLFTSEQRVIPPISMQLNTNEYIMKEQKKNNKQL